MYSYFRGITGGVRQEISQVYTEGDCLPRKPNLASQTKNTAWGSALRKTSRPFLFICVYQVCRIP